MPGFAGHYYMWPEEYWLLSKYVDLTRGDYLEIGSMCGIIAASFARKYPSRKFVCVDYFEAGHGTIAGKRDTFLDNMEQHKLDNVRLIEGNSLQVVPTLEQQFDIAFVDANHAYDYVLADAFNCWKRVTPGGYLAFHDYECVEETTQAVNEFSRQAGAPVVEAVSGIAVLSKPLEARKVDDPYTQNRLLQEELDQLRIRLGGHEAQQAEVSSLKAECGGLVNKIKMLETTLNSIENSKGWRALNYYRRVRNSVLNKKSL